MLPDLCMAVLLWHLCIKVKHLGIGRSCLLFSITCFYSVFSCCYSKISLRVISNTLQQDREPRRKPLDNFGASAEDWNQKENQGQAQKRVQECTFEAKNMVPETVVAPVSFFAICNHVETTFNWHCIQHKYSIWKMFGRTKIHCLILQCKTPKSRTVKTSICCFTNICM